MHIRTKIAALAVAALTVAVTGGTIAATAGSASAATPSCGIGCINIFSQQFGTHKSPNYTVDVLRQKEAVGQPVILFRAANYDPALDWSAAFQGTVADFYAAGLVSSALALHYGCIAPSLPATPGNFPTCANPLGAPFPDDYAFEIEYAPFGVDSGLCMGVPVTAVAGTDVSLQPCGVSSKSVWVVDQSDASNGRVNPALSEYAPLINGSDTNFSDPFVLTYPANSVPTDKPRPQLFVSNLTGFTNPVTGDPEGVKSSQMYGVTLGELK